MLKAITTGKLCALFKQLESKGVWGFPSTNLSRNHQACSRLLQSRCNLLLHTTFRVLAFHTLFVFKVQYTYKIEAQTRSSTKPPHNLPTEIPKCHPRLPIHHILQIRLRKYSQRIPRNPHPLLATASGSYEMRHRSELAPSNYLQSFACLKCQTVVRNAYLDDTGVAGVDVEPRAR